MRLRPQARCWSGKGKRGTRRFAGDHRYGAGKRRDSYNVVARLRGTTEPADHVLCGAPWDPNDTTDGMRKAIR
jgi:hypothetical protein